MSKVLEDYNGNNINIGDIIVRENLKNGEKTYFLYEEETIKNRGVLYKYDKFGKLNKENIMHNIYIDDGIDIISNYDKRWVRIGKKEEVYNEIFKKDK